MKLAGHGLGLLELSWGFLVIFRKGFFFTLDNTCTSFLHLKFVQSS